MASYKITGFNPKEQALFDRLFDKEPHDISELKKIFWKEATKHCERIYEPGWAEREVNSQAQSFVRNSIRRLIRDGWVELCARGTYRMSKQGIDWIHKGITVTKSALESKKEVKKKKVIKKEKKKSIKSNKKEIKQTESKKKKITKAESKKKITEKKVNKKEKKATKKSKSGNGISQKTAAAKDRATKELVLEKARQAVARIEAELEELNENA